VRDDGSVEDGGEPAGEDQAEVVLRDIVTGTRIHARFRRQRPVLAVLAYLG
jgi:hypothetical protein